MVTVVETLTSEQMDGVFHVFIKYNSINSCFVYLYNEGGTLISTESLGNAGYAYNTIYNGDNDSSVVQKTYVGARNADNVEGNNLIHADHPMYYVNIYDKMTTPGEDQLLIAYTNSEYTAPVSMANFTPN